MFGTPATNLHSPGPIGDVTPATLAGTTLNLTSTATQFTITYSAGVFGTVSVDSGGNITIDQSSTDKVTIKRNGATALLMQDAIVYSNPTAAAAAFCTATANQQSAVIARYDVSGNPYSGGTGIGDAGTTQTLGLMANGAVYAALTSTLFKLTSGVALQLGGAATTGLSAGALAATTNASIVIKDSTGQSYRIPCII